MNLHTKIFITAVLSALVFSGAAEAQCAICDSPFLTMAINSVGDSANQTTKAVMYVKSAVQETTEHMDRDFQAQVSSEKEVAQENLAQAGVQDAIRQGNGSLNLAYACSNANRAEAIGQGTVSQAGYYGAISASTHAWNVGVGKRSDPEKKLEAMPQGEFVPQFVLSPAGTLGPADITRAHDFNMMMINPYPPTDSQKLPDIYKSRPEAKQYDTLYKLYNANTELNGKVINRGVELMAPSIAVTADQISDWNDIRGSMPAPTNVAGTDDGTQYPDQRAALVPVNGMISELDFMRTEVFKRYADPKWRGPVLEAMNDTLLLKEMNWQIAVQNRMLYEMMLSSNALAYNSAVHAAHESGGEYGAKLAEIEASMRGNH